jgi:hypothetical protein
MWVGGVYTLGRMDDHSMFPENNLEKYWRSKKHRAWALCVHIRFLKISIKRVRVPASGPLRGTAGAKAPKNVLKKPISFLAREQTPFDTHTYQQRTTTKTIPRKKY